MHHTINILNTFYSGPDKNRTKKILNISRSHLTRLISIITGFNCLSYIQFKANSIINPLCRLCGEENETFWHFATECPRLHTHRNDTFLDAPPQQDNWKLNQIIFVFPPLVILIVLLVIRHRAFVRIRRRLLLSRCVLRGCVDVGLIIRACGFLSCNVQFWVELVVEQGDVPCSFCNS